MESGGTLYPEPIAPSSTAGQGVLHTISRHCCLAFGDSSQRQQGERSRSRAGTRRGAGSRDKELGQDNGKRRGVASREKEPGQDPGTRSRAGHRDKDPGTRSRSYLSPLPAELHQHGRSLVDLAAIEHPAACQHHGHPLCHGPPELRGSPEIPSLL